MKPHNENDDDQVCGRHPAPHLAELVSSMDRGCGPTLRRTARIPLCSLVLLTVLAAASSVTAVPQRSLATCDNSREIGGCSLQLLTVPQTDVPTGHGYACCSTWTRDKCFDDGEHVAYYLTNSKYYDNCPDYVWRCTSEGEDLGLCEDDECLTSLGLPVFSKCTEVESESEETGGLPRQSGSGSSSMSLTGTRMVAFLLAVLGQIAL